MAGTRHTRARTRKRSCVGKHPFGSHAAALRYRMGRIAAGAAEWTCAIYSCRFCGARHVGHRPAEQYSRTARR